VSRRTGALLDVRAINSTNNPIFDENKGYGARIAKAHSIFIMGRFFKHPSWGIKIMVFQIQ
jgi:hypothetical protein